MTVSNQASISRDFARSRLEQALAQGIVSAGPVIERVLTRMPQDEIAHHSKVVVRVNDAGLPIVESPRANAPMTDFSFGQLAERAGLPIRYARELADGARSHALEAAKPRLREPRPEDARNWQGDLLAHSMNELLAHSADRMLLRRVDGQTRGVLSDKFKRMDSRPGLEAFVTAAQELGAVPLEGRQTETRDVIRCIIPTIHEPVPGEALAFGLHWGNSDFGNGSYNVTLFMFRLVCWNGMVGASALRKTHVGRVLEDDFEYSEKTRMLTMDALASQTTDVVRAYLAPAAIEERLAEVRRCHETEVDFKKAWAAVGKALPKSVQEAAQAAFEGPDDINMPAGKNLWRFKNALSWVANSDQVSAETRLDLQRAAGKA